MHVSAYIMPRRVILALLILLGLFLRLWGLSWPQEETAPYYPEWGEQVIANLSVLKMVYREVIWTQGLYGVAYLIKGILAGAAGWVEVWLGLAKVSSEVNLQSLLAGRLAVALMGTAQIWLAYQVARRWFNSLGTGLLAAAWLAVSPLMVMESHYLAGGVPLGFMTLICMWCAHSLQKSFRYWHFILAGLCLGLTLTIKASGILIAPVFLWAFFLAWRQRRPSWRLLLGWFFAFLFGLWLGLTLGSPGFVLMLFRMHRNVWDSLLLPPLLDGAGWQYVAARAGQLYELMNNWVGWLWLALWLAGLAALLAKRNLLRISLFFFPPLYLAASLLFLTSPMENLLAAIMPLFIILAVWPIVLVCRRIPGRRLPGWTLAVLATVLLCYPLLNSLRISYLFWQQPALSSALIWSKDNLPEELAHNSSEDNSAWLLLPATENPGNLQLIKNFDLVSDWAPKWLPRTMRLARPYSLYGRQPAITLKQPLSHARLPINPEAPFSAVFADHMAYSRNESSVFMAKPMVAQRLLRFSGPAELKVRLRNLGDKLATVQVQQGPWLSRFVELYPGQESSLEFRARAWPMLMGNTFPISFRLHQGAQVWADWQWDSLQIAFQDTLRHQPLNGRLEGNPAFAAKAMLLLDAARAGNWAKVEAITQEMNNPVYDEAFALAQEQDDPKWFDKLAAYAGLNSQYLLNASRIIYPLESPASGEDKLYISGHGFSGIVERQPLEREGWLSLLLEDRLNQGHWQLGVELKEKTGQPLEMELWGREKLAQAVMPAGSKVAYLPFTQPESAYPLQLKIKLPQQSVSFKHISLACDLKAHLRQLHDWCQEAVARLYLQQGRHAMALDCLRAINGQLSDELLYLELSALVASGANEQALIAAEQLMSAWQNLPLKLAMLRDVFRSLGQSERLPELGRRIADLRPSISKSAPFTNGLNLLGYDGPASGELIPGSRLNYNFYWQAGIRPYLDTLIFLQLIGPNTNIIQTHRLSNGQRPMTSLQPGEVVRESCQFSLPENMAPGSYRLVMGLWDKEHKNQRLNITDGEARGASELQLFSMEVK